MHSWGEPSKSKQRKMGDDLLRIVDAWACFVTMTLSSTKHPSTGLGFFAAKTNHKSKVAGSYYETLVHHDQSSKEHTKKVYGNRA